MMSSSDSKVKQLLAEDDDVSLMEYMYVIGFTENQYYPTTHGSPTPGEPRHSTLARGYAERCNKGAEKILSGASEVLERRRRKSVTKIHTDMLDLVYELSERRKATSPAPKFRRDLQMIESRLSMYSPPLSCSSRSSSSNSLPIIEVQQLPPLFQANISLPAINPEVNKYQFRSTLRKDKSKSTFPTFSKVSKTINKPKNLTAADRAQREMIKTKQKENPDNAFIETEKTDFFKSNEIRPKPILKRRNAGLTFLENLNSNRFVGKYARTNYNMPKGKHLRDMSYCQSSYKERAERDRIDNVMRRYSSKTNAGPLDFTKLQRQIERSKTMIW